MKDIDFEEIIVELTEQFKKTIPDSEQNLADAFKEYLYLSVESIKGSKSRFVLKDDESIEKNLRTSTSELMAADLDTKKRRLLMDVNFDKILAFSNRAYEIARRSLMGERVSIENDDYFSKYDELKKVLELVEPYNQQQARELLSEGILDVEFVKNPASNITSLRIGRIKNALENSNTGKQKEEEGDER